VHWSVEPVSFVCAKRFAISDILPLGSLYIVIFVCVGAFAVSVFRKARADRDELDERQPFISKQVDDRGRKRKRPRKRGPP
jgi:hypothetical protein